MEILLALDARTILWGWGGKSSEWPRYGNICHVIIAKPWQIPSLKWVSATVSWYFRA